MTRSLAWVGCATARVGNITRVQKVPTSNFAGERPCGRVFGWQLRNAVRQGEKQKAKQPPRKGFPTLVKESSEPSNKPSARAHWK